MWCDVSEWQAPGSVDFAKYDAVIIRASHGTTEDLHWRKHFDDTVAAGRRVGLYHFAEEHPSPAAQASFFHGLVGFLKPPQVWAGFWLDGEPNNDDGDPWAGPNSPWVDQFRSAVALPWCGLYGNLSSFNTRCQAYMHFGLNWLAMPIGTTLPAGWAIPDHVLVQAGTVNGVDQDLPTVAQPYPGAWAA